MKIGKYLALTALACVLPLRSAKAQNFCYAGNLWTCFSVTVSTTNNGAAGTDVEMYVRNTSTAQGGLATWLTAIGLSAPSNIGSTSLLAVTSDGQVLKQGNAGNDWSFSTNASYGFGSVSLATATSSPDPKTGAIMGCGAVGSSTRYFDTCAPSWPGFVKFSFHTTGAWDAQDAVVLAKWQGGGLANSVECSTGASGITSCTPPSVVPEPVTMVLLGTGLASMGGFGFLRRRKRNGDIEST